MTDRTVIIIGIVSGAIAVAFITVIAITASRDYSLWNIVWIDLAMVLVAAISTWRGLLILRNRRLDHQARQLD